MSIIDLPSLESTRKSALIDKNGVKYTEFKAALKPKYHMVWIQIALGYLILAGTLMASAWFQKHYPGFFWLNIPLSAINIGYWFTSTHLFIHEAAHYNIAPGRKLNDRLANVFLGLIPGMHIEFYRIIHFDHHRYLGTTKDTENTYFEPLNWKFVIESLTGIRVLRVMAARNKMVLANENLNPEVLKSNKKMTIAGALFNLALVIILCVMGYWQAALAWMGGIGVIFPFFLSLRQLLEHRSEKADATVDYNKQDHGETNRMFGGGIINATLGSAGFNRHLLHHWDPQVSCTRLKEVEGFLKETELAGEIQKTRTNYFRTLLKLFNK